HQEIVHEFTKLYPNLKIDRSTVTKILKQADEYSQLKNDEQAKTTFRHRFVKYPKLELTMNIWIEQVTNHGLIISDSLIKEKGSKCPLENLPTERTKLQELLSQYNPDDIYNADET
ncbi:20469_t:CDS:2, partial [Gigaspora rosea]